MKKTVTILALLCLSTPVFATGNKVEECPVPTNGTDGIDGTDGTDGRNGRNGRDGKDGVTTVITKSVCPTCIEERIQMGDAVSAAIPETTLREGKKYGTYVGFGFAESQQAIGLSGAVRLTDSITASAGIATNLSPICDDYQACVNNYEAFQYISGRIQIGMEF